jgi:aminoglycoside phosphotransferase (APT) family kinase protein
MSFHFRFDVSEEFSKIVALVEPGSMPVRHTNLGGGISCTMTLLEVVTSSSETKRLVVRQVGKWSFEHFPDSVRNEFSLLTFLSENGIPVPTPLYVDTSNTILTRPYLVLDYVDGSPDLETNDRKRRAINMANQLADIHSLDVSNAAFDFITPSVVNIRPATGPLNEALQEANVRSALILALPMVEENDYRFRHGDFWPGNLLWKDGEIAAVIDWEETSIGDPLFDVAIARLDILWAYGEEAMNAFTNQYRKRMDIDFTHLPFWDLRVSLRPMENIAGWATAFPTLGRHDVTEETMIRGHRWFVDQALNKL